jgi:hypothetical protein
LPGAGETLSAILCGGEEVGRAALAGRQQHILTHGMAFLPPVGQQMLDRDDAFGEAPRDQVVDALGPRTRMAAERPASS